MQDLWTELIASMEAIDPSRVSAFRPGLKRTDILERLSRLPFDVSPDAIDLYQLADGCDAWCEVLPGVELVPLDDAIADCLSAYAMRDQLDAIFPEPLRDTLRFLADGSDGGYGFGRLDSVSHGQIVDHCIHEARRIAFSDLRRVLQTAIECYKRGVFEAEVPDFKMYFEIGAELNPEHEWKA